MAWRRDLDYVITCYERDQDLERARAELSPKDQRLFDNTFGTGMQGSTFNADSRKSVLMRKLTSGPVSATEALRLSGRSA